MSIERKWFYEGHGNPAEADGRQCLFCSKPIVDEPCPARWVLKAEEDDQDTDYILEDGYAHLTCHEAKVAADGKSRFSLPEVPDLPKH